MKTKIAVSTIAVLCAMASMPAFAQSQISPEKTAEKAIVETPTDSPKGYMLGNILLTPSLTVNEEYNDNIYTEESHEVGDFITHVIPRFTAELKNAAHQLKIAAGLEQTIYADETQNDYMNYDASVSDRYNFDKTAYWTGMASYRKRNSLPGDDDANPGADAGEPIPYNIYDANTRVFKDFGSFDVSPRLGMRRYEFEDVRRKNGVMLDEGFRDRDEYDVGGRANVDVNKETQLFTDLDWHPVNYLASSTTDRDSTGGNYLAGVRWTPSKVFAVEAGLGYLNRNYDTTGYDDIHTLGATVSVAYTPSKNTKATFDYDRSTIEVTDAGVGGAIRDDLKAGFSNDLTDLLKGHVNLRYAHTDYQGGNGATGGTDDRTDKYYSAGAGLAYSLTESVALTADYTYGKNNSNRNTSDYDQNVVLLGIKAGF